MPRRVARAGLRALALGLLLLAPAPLVAPPIWAGLPPEDQCPTLALGSAPGHPEDVTPTPLREGMVLTAEQVLALRSLLPEEVWTHRDVFFHEGMRMEIGPCHRRYPVPPFFREATESLHDKVSLDADGNLKGWVAGLPFPPEAIDLAAPDAALRWAWDYALRYRGAGPIGKFRLVDLPSRVGSVETYIGSFFFIQTSGRADLAASGYREPTVKDALWAAGGQFDEPFNARHLAWRQFRSSESARDYASVDDVFVYVPTMRKPRRAATAWVDGLFMPRYRVSGDAGGGGVPIGGGSGPAGLQGSVQPTAGISAAASENLRRGFTGLVVRPNAYRWRLLGERDVLAPLNGSQPGWPVAPDRNYGESGLSVASDRWDVRHAVVLEGVARKTDDEVARLTLWVDWQTQQPLYFITRRANGLLVDIGILVHRFSGDIAEYPDWPDGRGRALVFDPVAESFFSAGEGRSGWRRESYDVRSVPVSEEQLRVMTTTDSLVKGR